MVRFAPLLLLACAGPAFAQALTAEQLAKLKAATVFVKVAGSTFRGTGSGFLVRADKDTGYIVTNAHVIDPVFEVRVAGEDVPEAMSAATVDVVFQSGTPNELVRRVTVVASDIDRDLAVLKVSVANELPTPVDLADPPKLLETMKVYVCGFPFGGQLAVGAKNPEISIGEASVSSIRSNGAGQVAEVQLNGALNPGNSGGPVVSADGKLVGVAVKTIRGAGLGLAIPQHEVAQTLRGRIGRVRLVPGVIGDGDVPAKLSLDVIDPLGKIKTVTAHYATAVGDVPAMSAAMPTLMPGLTKLPMAVAAGRATASLTLPAKQKGALVQFEIDTTEGKVLSVPTGVPLTLPREGSMPGSTEGGRPQIRLPGGQLLPFPTRRRPTTDTDDGDTGALADLNRAPSTSLGKTLSVDGLTSCEVTEREKLYELTVENAAGRNPQNLLVSVPKDLGLQLADLGLYAPGFPVQYTFAVRLTGTVKKPAGRDDRHILDVSEVGFLDGGKVTVTVKAESAAPAGKPTLSAVNRFPDQFVGKPLTLDARLTGVRQSGATYGLDLENENRARPLNLEFFAAKDLCSTVQSEVPSGTRAVRVTLTVERLDPKTGHGLVGISQVEVLPEAEGGKSKTLRGEGKIAYPAAAVVRGPVKVDAPATTPAKAESKAAPAPANEGSLVVVILAVVGTLTAVAGAGIIFVVMRNRAATPAAPPKYGRRAEPEPPVVPPKKPASPAKPADEFPGWGD